MEDLKDYLKELILIRKELSLINWTDGELADIGCRIFISQNISNQKKENIKDMKENRNFQPLTKSQYWYISKNTDMKKEDIENLSKTDASILIKELKEGKDGEV